MQLRKTDTASLSGKLTKGIALLLAGAIAMNISTTWGGVFVSGKWRYRMTVTVETPEGLKTGSAVREVKVEKGLKLLPEMGASIALKGEAIVIDLGHRGVLFALMRGGMQGADYAKLLPFEVFPYEKGEMTTEGIHYYSGLKKDKALLKPEQYPMIVRFKKLTDPLTVETVYNVKRNGLKGKPFIFNKIDDVFGKDVVLRSVLVEMTQDTVTNDVITKYLPWLDKINGYLDGQFASGQGNGLANVLEKGDFTRSKDSE